MKSDGSALLIVAHGSTVNPDSSAPTLAHAAFTAIDRVTIAYSELIGRGRH